ncbi:MAG: hypothetical protein IJ234_00885 [Clostridia bacterium]|nr:hypothetical protein [Clostridia bacterium]
MNKMLALLLAALLCLNIAVLAEENSIEDTSMETPQTYTDPYSADLVVGYLAQGGVAVNPFVCNEWDIVNLNQLVFESMVELDANQKPSPMLADNWTHEGKTWTFTLRSGIFFHNGYELNAMDVQNSFDAYMAAADRNPYSDRLSRLVSDLRAEDDRTVVVQGKYEGYLTLYAMTFPIVQSETIYDELPRGTGPYWYVNYEADSTIRIEVNPLWWKKQATTDSILFRHYPDAGTALEGLQRGQIDMFAARSTNAAVFRKLANLTSMDFATTTYEMLVPNTNADSILSDLNVRKAIMYAINRTELASGAYLDMAIQSEVPVLPGTWLYESQSARYYYSPERALQLLYDAGWSDLTGDLKLSKLQGIQVKDLEIQIITYNDSTNSMRENAAQMIADDLNQIGIKATWRVITRDAVRRRLKNGEYDIALVGVNLSEVPIVYNLLVSRGTLNYNNYSDITMDALVEQSLDASDEGDLQRVYSQIQQRLVETLPFLGLLFRTGTVLSTRSLGALNGIRAMNTFRGLEYLSE